MHPLRYNPLPHALFHLPLSIHPLHLHRHSFPSSQELHHLLLERHLGRDIVLFVETDVDPLYFRQRVLLEESQQYALTLFLNPSSFPTSPHRANFTSRNRPCFRTACTSRYVSPSRQPYKLLLRGNLHSLQVQRLQRRSLHHSRQPRLRRVADPHVPRVYVKLPPSPYKVEIPANLRSETRGKARSARRPFHRPERVRRRDSRKGGNSGAWRKVTPADRDPAKSSRQDPPPPARARIPRLSSAPTRRPPRR